MNTIKIVMLLSMGLIFSSSSCDKERDESSDDRLTLEKVDYIGNELRIDGYYYHYYYAGTGKEQQLRGVTPCFLYQNGIILHGVSFILDQIPGMEENFRNGSYALDAAKYKYDWGVFQIDGSKIKYEKWVPVDGPLLAVTYEGEILNDTTFIINKYYRIKDIDKKAPTEINWEYHFKQFSPKPDSTNRFIP